VPVGCDDWQIGLAWLPVAGGFVGGRGARACVSSSKGQNFD